MSLPPVDCTLCFPPDNGQHRVINMGNTFKEAGFMVPTVGFQIRWSGWLNLNLFHDELETLNKTIGKYDEVDAVI